jgi:hypothetical protein
VLASAATAAPLLRRLSRTHGQAVFYAAAQGQWAYDDPVARNGVFTTAVIDGLKCAAPKNGNYVTADTLAGHVERYVQAWIRKNRDPNVGSATQASIDGEARNMPLARCGGPISGGPERVAAAGTAVRALSKKNELLWQHDAGAAVTHAEAADLDADGWCEVVFGTRDAVTALDRDGKQLWSAREPMALTAFVTGDVFRQRTHEVVALWNGEHASRIAVYDADGKSRGGFDDVRRFDHVAIVRATGHYKPRIVVASGNTVLAFDPKKLSAGKPLWAGRVGAPIASLAEGDGNGDGKRDIAVTTTGGKKLFIDVNGHALQSRSAPHFQRLSPKRGRSR